MGIKPIGDIFGMCAQVGIGTAAPSEASKNGRPLIWTAIKRAETDLLKQLYPNLERPEHGAEAARQAIAKMEQVSLDETDEQRQAIAESLTDGDLLPWVEGETVEAKNDDWDADTFGAHQEPESTNGKEPPAEPEPEPVSELDAYTVSEFYKVTFVSSTQM